MRYKTDENLPDRVAQHLRETGLDVMTVKEQGLSGVADEELIPIVEREGRVLLTLDVGIGNLKRFPPATTGGIVLYRPDGVGLQAIIELVTATWPQVSSLCRPGRLIVATPRAVRVRD